MGSMNPIGKLAGGATVRRVVQVLAHLSCPDGDAQKAAGTAIKECLKWLSKPNRVGQLPSRAWNRESFEVDAVGKRLEVVATGQGFWVARFEHPDGDIPGRVWSTELAVAAIPDSPPIFGLRLTCASHGTDAPFHATIPGIVRQLARRPGLEEGGQPLTEKTWPVENEEDVEALVDFLQDRGRRKPVLVVSEQENGSSAVDAAQLAWKTVGVGYVAVLPHQLSFKLSDAIGRRLSVWGGAVRTYMPDFDPEDAQNRHPIAFGRTIVEHPNGADGFVEQIAQRICRGSTNGADALRRMPTFATWKSYLTSSEREAAKQVLESKTEDGDLKEYVRALEDDNAALSSRINELQRDNGEFSDLYNVRDEEAKAAEQEAEAQKARALHWISEAARLRKELADIRGSGNQPVTDPDTLDQVAHWIDAYYSDRMRITTKAAKAASRSPYQNVSQVYKALRVLAEDYWGCKTGGGDWAQMNLKLQELGLELKASLVSGDYSAFGDEYKFNWGGEEKKYFDLHLKGNSSRDPRVGLRIYFHWFSEEEIVVIGWLTTHLRNHNTD